MRYYMLSRTANITKYLIHQMSNVSNYPYAQSLEVQHMCVVNKGCDHGPAPIPEEGKWIQAKQITTCYTHRQLVTQGVPAPTIT